MTCQIEDVKITPVKTPLTIGEVKIDAVVAELFITEVIVNKVGC